MSRTSRSAAILAAWPSHRGILTRLPTSDDVRVGIIQSYFLHTPLIANQESKPHLLAQVDWLQDHPCKFLLKNGIVLSTTVPEPTQCSLFMPVSRIISQCATVNKTMQLSTGEDHI